MHLSRGRTVIAINICELCTLSMTNEWAAEIDGLVMEQPRLCDSSLPEIKMFFIFCEFFLCFQFFANICTATATIFGISPVSGGSAS